MPTPARLRYRIEVPRGGFRKRSPEGRVEFLSPLPCPFNYGSALDTRSADGEPEDVVVLGPRLAAGAEGELPVWGVVRFWDGGGRDDKWICAARAPSRRQRALVRAFFAVYARGKRLLGRGSRLEGVEWLPR